MRAGVTGLCFSSILSVWNVRKNFSQQITFKKQTLCYITSVYPGGSLEPFLGLSWQVDLKVIVSALRNPIVAKVEDTVDPRRQGWSCSNLPRTLDNKGDAIYSAFPWGKKHDKVNRWSWNSRLVISRNSLALRQNPCYYWFLYPLVMFFMRR